MLILYEVSLIVDTFMKQLWKSSHDRNKTVVVSFQGNDLNDFGSSW